MAISEAEVCAKFTKEATEAGFKVYPEVSSWDMVLVWDRAPEIKKRIYKGEERVVWQLLPGDQIAVEAKAKSTPEAFSQAISRQNRMVKSGPNFIALLAPSWKGYELIAQRCGFMLFDSSYYEEEIVRSSRTGKKSRIKFINTIKPPERMRLHFEKGLWLPPVISDKIIAGSSSPESLTKWRVEALRMCARLRNGDKVTSKDFKDVGLNIDTWRHKGRRWIVDSGEKIGRLKLYELGVPIKSSFPDIGWEGTRNAIVESDKDS